MYIPLYNKTTYTFLSSLLEVDDLIDLAKMNNLDSIAICDDNMFGVPEFYDECKKNNIKPIIGIELTIDNKKILLYAINNNGYKNLIKLSTLISERPLTKEDLIEYKEDILLIIPYKYFDEEIYKIYTKHYIGYSTLIEKEKIKEDKVFINDVSYLYKEDYKYLDYLYMIKEQKILGEYELNTHKNQHLLSKDELVELTTKEDIQNTNYISSLCNVELTNNKNLT